MELELYDNMRKAFRVNFGDIAIANAWKVSRLSATQLLISPGEAWINGLSFELRAGNDWLVSSATVTSGLLPAGVTLTDAADGSGKILTFANTGPNQVATDNYRVVITASEQIIDFTKDPFLQNANIPEPTASKVRLVYTVNVVSAYNQAPTLPYDTVSPIPYQSDNTAPYVLSNTIKVVPQPSLSPYIGCLVAGSQPSIVQLASGQIIDGRTLELTFSNPAGANPFPISSADQAQFENGTLVDQHGNEYHINAIFNDTVADRVIVRISQEVGQAAPTLPVVSGASDPYYIKKQDVYYGDDTTGLPTGKYHWHVATAAWNNVSGFLHTSSVTDLRTSIVEQDQFEALVNAKFDLTATRGGAIGLAPDGQTLSWSDNFVLVNPAGQVQTIPANTVIILDGGSLVYKTSLLANTPQALGKGNLIVSVTTGGSTLILGDTPNLSAASVGNPVALPTITKTFLPTDVSLINNSITSTAHGFNVGDIIIFTSTGTLPSPLAANTQYYVVNTTTDTFEVAGNLTGTPVTLSTIGSGTHSAFTKYTAVAAITAIDDVNETLTVSSSLGYAGPAIIFQDSYAAGKAPRTSANYTLAARSDGQVVIANQLELAAGQSNVIYDERLLLAGGLSLGVPLTLPANTRFMGRQKYYDTSNRSLEVYVNQLLKYQSTDNATGDWVAVDSTRISFLYPLPNNTEVHFRDKSLPAGPLGSATGNSNNISLQQAYNTGSSITTSSGTPLTVNGNAGEDLLVVNGNAKITGVLDPAGIELTSQAANPLHSGMGGLWINTSNQLIHQKPAGSNNITTQIAGLLDGTLIPRDPAGAVGLTASGLKVNVDGSTLNINGSNQVAVKALGVTATEIAAGAVTPLKLGTVTDGVTLDQIGLGSTLEIKAGGVGTTQLAAGSVTPTILGTVTDNITLDQSGTGSKLEIKAGGVGPTQIATAAVDGTTITGGGGTALSVVASPANKLVLVAGQTFNANTSYLVRMAITGETAGRVYVADSANAASTLKFWAIGMVSGGATGVTAGTNVNALLSGVWTLGSSDTPFNATDVGRAVWLNANGTFSVTPATASGAAAYKVGVVMTTTTLLIDSKQLTGINA